MTCSLLRYPGGKTKLLPLLTEIIKLNSLQDLFYVEPYAGGAGIALNLLLNGQASKIAINDKDEAIYAFWYTVLYDSETLCTLIRDTKITIEEWHKQKEIFKNKSSASRIELAFATFFLNRTNRAGVLGGGVIGGKNQDGLYKLDCRFNKENLIQRIEKIAQKRDRITLSNLDAIEFLGIIKRA